MRRVAAFLITAALYLQSVVPAFASSGRYDAFGNELATSGTWNGPFTHGGPFGYQKDTDSNLQLLGNRYYDPELGRFLTRDVAKDGRNWYTYAENNPLIAVDPTGYLWVYYQSTGELWHVTLEEDFKKKHKESGFLTAVLTSKKMLSAVYVATGYSGADEGRNNPVLQDRHNVGPIPRGKYTIGPESDRTPGGRRLNNMALAPDPKNEMHRRSGFLIHGDNATHTASEGCIILNRETRLRIANSGDHDLEVRR